MNTIDKLSIAKKVCGFAMGWTIGGIVNSVVKPKGAVDSILTMVGTATIALTAAPVFDKAWNEIFEDVIAECEEDCDV